MTEDDTFRALKKPTLQGMRFLVLELLRTTGPVSDTFYQKRSELLKQYGWTDQEYRLAKEQHHLRKNHDPR